MLAFRLLTWMVLTRMLKKTYLEINFTIFLWWVLIFSLSVFTKGCMAAFRVLTWKLLTCRGGPLATRCRPSTAASALCSSLASATLLLGIQIKDIQPRLGNFHIHVGKTKNATDLKVLLIVHLGPVLLQHQVDVQPRVDAELVSS